MNLPPVSSRGDTKLKVKGTPQLTQQNNIARLHFTAGLDGLNVEAEAVEAVEV